jgi:hypothetical protein
MQDTAAPIVDDTDTDIVISDTQTLWLLLRTVLCATECLPAYETDRVANRVKCSVSSAQDGRMTTWVPTTHAFVMLMGTERGENKVVIAKTGVAYTLSPELQVKPLASGVILMCTCTVDYDGSFKVLVYDGEDLPPTQDELDSFKDSADVPDRLSTNSSHRYARLLEFFPSVFGFSDAARTTFVLQWVGYYECALQFMSGAIAVPHSVGGLLTTTEDVLTPTRPVSIKIPAICIQRFNETVDGQKKVNALNVNPRDDGISTGGG